jgi:hypothetical protein
MMKLHFNVMGVAKPKESIHGCRRTWGKTAGFSPQAKYRWQGMGTAESGTAINALMLLYMTLTFGCPSCFYHSQAYSHGSIHGLGLCKGKPYGKD